VRGIKRAALGRLFTYESGPRDTVFIEMAIFMFRRYVVG
jgi:hypothetical protein